MRKAVTYLLAVVLVSSWGFLSSVSEVWTVRAQGAALELKRVHPTVITAGTRTFTMRLDGRRFVSGANVLFDGVALASPRVSKKGKVLLAEVDASLIASPGTHTVQALNPDGTTSPTATLTVKAQDPNLQIRLDGNAAEEDSGLIFLPTVLAESLEKGGILVWGRGTATTEVPNGFQIEISEDFVNDPAAIPITLVDKDGNLSNTELFFVVPKPVKIFEVDPAALEVGTEDVPLIVTGNFKPGATIILNDMELVTTVGKNDRLEATIPGSLRSQPDRLVLRVEQEGVQSQDTIIPVTPTTGPFIFTLAPFRFRDGEERRSIDIIGANFDKKVTAKVDGQDAFIRAITRSRLTVAIEPNAAVGSHTVQVIDKDGNATVIVTFEVVPDVTVSTLAGTGKGGFDPGCVSGDDARFLRPRRLALGPDGLLYITDQQNHAIRTVDTNTRQTCTFAGTGEEGYNDSGNALGKLPTFSFPNGVAVAGDGTVYVTENGNCVVRRIERSGAGITVSTFAGLFNDLTIENRQNRLNSTRQGLASYRDAGLLDSGFRLPDDIVIAPNGAIYIADAGNHAIRRITQSGGQSLVETIAGNGVPGFSDGAAGKARFNTPTALALSADGNFLFVTDTNNGRVRRIDLVNRRVSTVAGGGDSDLVNGPGGLAVFFQPIGLALDSDGVLYVSEFGASDIRRIDSAGNVTTLAGGLSIKLRDGPGVDAGFNQPRGLAIDIQRGVLYVADYENFAIRKITLR
ncbi:MAG: SMP-30/gluconolactonase/LRE family protein [Acidobacteriota bacterium]